ncbi:MAG TPA: prolyl oligopeptidase family serine peptidase [Candidatus Lustribacter sp.]
MPVISRFLILVAVAACLAGAATRTAATDPFLWLENSGSARVHAWVKAENAKTLAVLQRDPRFAGFYASALAINDAKDRIPYPTVIGGQVYNFWQDATHVRGIWRTTTIADYAKPAPAWKTVLDLDALAKAERKNWVWQGADCTSPSGQRCLISLSEGGEDAATIREFDLPSHQFVKGGFSLPRGKQSAAWLSDDTLLVAREWQRGDVTASGYPYIVKTLERGQPLSAAFELMRGKRSDVGTSVTELQDGDRHRLLLIHRNVTFFESQVVAVTTGGLLRLNLPLKSDLRALVDGRVLISLAQPWNVNGQTFPSGALVSIYLDPLLKDPQHLKPALVYAPGPRASLGDVSATGHELVVTTLDNVRGRATIYTPGASADNSWSEHSLTVPDNATIDLVSTDDHGYTAYLAVTRFLAPTTMLQVNTDINTMSVIKTLPKRFDASHDVVQQRAATSKDGTRIPYFIVNPKNMKLDGRNPTLLYAYGGFGASQTPFYSGSYGKLWLERGGVFVLANIRGGDEFGLAWHEAGLKTHRQRIFDDFTAVARDLIARKITSPRRLGIQGGSNGGLLMGVSFTQHPELFHAVDIQMPLLDMLRYEKIAAGASWVGEYGSVSNPRERAFLASISPYNNLKPGVRYPEPLVWTRANDDRVGPQHARKFAAKLAAMKIPYLFYEAGEGGHATGANIKERSFTTALEFTYLARELMNGGR